jgi:hypothetical protein
MIRRVANIALLILGLLVIGLGFSYLDRFDRWLGCDTSQVETCLARLIDWTFHRQSAPDQDDAAAARAKAACIRIQERYRIRRQSPVTDEQIDLFCECFANGLARSATADDREYLAQTGEVPLALMTKLMQHVTHECENRALN